MVCVGAKSFSGLSIMVLFSSVVGTLVDQVSLLFRDVTNKLITKWFVLCLGNIKCVFDMSKSEINIECW